MDTKIFSLFDQIREGNLEKTRELLEANSNLINKYLYGVTPFMYSLECGQLEIALELATKPEVDFSLRDNLDSCCLEKAIDSKLYKIVEIIVQMSNKDSNRFYLSNNETFLTNSLKMNDQEVSKALIRGGFDLNVPNKMNEYPIQLAIKFNQIGVIKEMLSTKNLFIQTIQLDESVSYNPLIDCCEKDSTEIAILLIENGAELNVNDSENSWTPLMYSIVNNNDLLVESLLNRKCDVNTVDVEGNTPLHLAAMSSDEYILKMILKMKPEKNVKNSNGQTALEIAIESEDDGIINLLS